MKKLENKFVTSSFRELLGLFKVWRSKQSAGTSPYIPLYEAELRKTFNISYASAVSNGTDALELILRANKIGIKDQILMPSYPPIMSAIPLLNIGIEPVFVDSEANTFNLDETDLLKKISNRTKAIIVVPMWGYPVKMEGLVKIAKKYGLLLIEDASHSHGSKIGSSMLGTIGTVGFFSTQERKMIATGEGGFILTNSERLHRLVVQTRDFGKVLDDDKQYPNHIGEYGFHPGSNYRITGFSAAIGIAQAKKLNRKITIRTANAHKILVGIKDLKNLSELCNMKNATNNYYSLVLVSGTDDSLKLGEVLSNNGIISDTYRFKIKPLYELPLLTKYVSHCPNTEELLKRIVTIPTHEGLEKADVERIIKVLRVYSQQQ